ncbi:MAG: family 16 glycosylhydrolase [Treponema sp.]|nr:family 16 glycosylhydrolase [Treponema sp.]
MKATKKMTVLAFNVLLMFTVLFFFSCPNNSTKNGGEEDKGPFNIEILTSIKNGSITVQGGVSLAESGSTVTLNISPASGYVIDTINVIPGIGDNVTVAINGNTASFTMPAANVVISAQFKEDDGGTTPKPPQPGEYSIIIKGPQTNGTVTVQGGLSSAAPGDIITLNITPNAGCALKSIGAQRDSGVTTPLMGSGSTRTFSMPSDNVTITAVFEKVAEYAITVGNFTGGTVTADKITAIQGEKVTLTATPDTGYFLSTVDVKAGATSVSLTYENASTRSFAMPAAGVVVNAVFMSGSDPLAAYFSNDFDSSLCSFFDKFDGTALDYTKWSHQNGRGEWGWGNNEAQSYETANVTVSDGTLKLTAKRSGSGYNGYTSGKLVTANGDTANGGSGNKFSQTYGRFEARIRMTGEAEGMWPAFWMMPVTTTYGGWPNSGEIDIMEQKGRLPLEASSTLHMQKDWGHHYRGADYNFANNGRITDWHVYSVVWSADNIIFLIDGLQHKNIPRADWRGSNAVDKGNASSSAPFDKNFFIILNLAIGGNYDVKPGYGNWPPAVSFLYTPPDSALPMSLEIDWVRAYTLANDPWPANFGTHPSRSFNN